MYSKKESMYTKKISIIVPVYGEPDYIGECIESITKQTYENIEIILVDDGSPDECPRICDEWKKRDNRIVVIHKPNGGLVSARQAGMEASTGEYIGYVDGDDWIEPDMYENLMREAETSKADIVIAGFKKNLYGKQIEYFNEIPAGTYDREGIESFILPQMISTGEFFQCGLYTYVWNKLFKREAVYRFQMQVDKKIVIGEDSACVYPAIAAANSITVVRQAGYHYRQRMDSLLRKTTGNQENVKRLKKFYDYTQQIFKEMNYASVLIKQLSDYYLSQMIMMSDALVQKCPGLGMTFPFNEIEKGSRVIIYSAGAYGIHLYNQFKQCKELSIVAWVDPDYEQYTGKECNVIDLKNALNLPYDNIVIASVDSKFINETRKILVENDVELNRIITINQNKSTILEILKTYGFIEDGE